MTDCIVRRWARYGHERLYAETPGGTALGYLDVKTGRFHSDDAANLALLQRAIADHLAGQEPAPESVPAAETSQEPKTRRGTPVPSAPGAPADVLGFEPATASPGNLAAQNTPGTTTAPGWEDLSGTRPGAAARERAIAAREAAPFRTAAARLLGLKTDERAWRIGADGEEAVAAQLAKMSPDWRVLHAIAVGERGADVDHLVIGPAGVFAVNAKHHPRSAIWVGGDTFMVNGHRVDYVRNSHFEASRAARLLTEHAGFPVTVTGIIAVMGAHNVNGQVVVPAGGQIEVPTPRG